MPDWDPEEGRRIAREKAKADCEDRIAAAVEKAREEERILVYTDLYRRFRSGDLRQIMVETMQEMRVSPKRGVAHACDRIIDALPITSPTED